jgi:hypothetical protein
MPLHHNLSQGECFVSTPNLRCIQREKSERLAFGALFSLPASTYMPDEAHCAHCRVRILRQGLRSVKAALQKMMIPS